MNSAKLQEGPFAMWAILELMGHRRLAGYVQEAQIAGASFIRLDIFQDSEKPDSYTTQFYSPGSVYCLTPTTETVARQIANTNTYRPVQSWELQPALEASHHPRESDDWSSDQDERH